VAYCRQDDILKQGEREKRVIKKSVELIILHWAAFESGLQIQIHASMPVLSEGQQLCL
jgi:hypothetical protein